MYSAMTNRESAWWPTPSLLRHAQHNASQEGNSSFLSSSIKFRYQVQISNTSTSSNIKHRTSNIEHQINRLPHRTSSQRRSILQPTTFHLLLCT